MIRILRNNIELNVVESTLTLTTKNTAFSDSFSLDYSQHPFLIIEDSNTVAALGSRHILSLNKQKEYDVVVFKDNKVYFGKLKIRSYVQGARKCDLVFGSELIKILDKQISEFLPTIYLGSNVPYEENTSELIPQQPIIDALALHENKLFPEVDFQFPEIYASNFYDSENYKFDAYENYINKRESGKLKVNVVTNPETNILKAENFSFLHPSIYLLSLIKHSFQSIGYQIKGDFVENDFIQNILVLSKNNNNCVRTIDYIGDSYHLPTDFSQAPENGFVKFSKALSEIGYGDFGLQIDFRNIPEPVLSDPRLQITVRLYPGTGFNSEHIFSFHRDELLKSAVNGLVTVKKHAKFQINSSNINWNLEVFLYHSEQKLPEFNEILIFPWYEKPKQYQIHPTVDLKRFSPNWSLYGLLNNCKNLFNLKLDFDDSLKTISLDFIDQYLNSNDMVDLSKFDLEIDGYENFESNVFKIGYANDEFVRIDKSGISEDPVIEKDAIEIINEFLTLPYNGTHNELTENNLEDGVVLVINNPTTPNTVEELNDQSLKLIGDKGIARKRWKDWVRFRQHASQVKLIGKLPKQIIVQIEQKKKIYFNNIVFLVDEISTKEKNGYTEVTLIVKSKSF